MKRVDGKVVRSHDSSRVAEYKRPKTESWIRVPAEWQKETLSEKQKRTICADPGAEFRYVCIGCGNPGMHRAGCSFMPGANVVLSKPISSFFNPIALSASPAPPAPSAPVLVSSPASLADGLSLLGPPSASQSSSKYAAEIASITQDILEEAAAASAALPGEPVASPPIDPPLSSPTPKAFVSLPFAEADAPTLSPGALEYAGAFLELVEAELPKMYAQEPTDTSFGKLHSNVFRFPHALALPRHPQLRRFAYTPEAFELSEVEVVLHDPQMFFPEYMGEKGLICPAGCKHGEDHAAPPERLERGGFGPLRAETVAFGKKLTLHRIVQFRCRRCKSDAHHTLYDPSVWAQVPKLVREAIGRYDVTSKSIMCHDTLVLIEALKLKGLSFQAMHDTSAQVYEEQRISQELMYMEQLQRLGGVGVASPSIDKRQFERSIISNPIAPVLSGELAAHKVIKAAERQGPFIQGDVLALSGQADRLFIDHNFQGKGVNRQGGRAFFHGLDQAGRLVAAMVTEGESLAEAHSAFARFVGVKMVWTDNPVKDANVLRRELPHKPLHVYGDVFHWEKRVNDAVKAGDLKASFARELSQALLCPVAEDVQALETRLVRHGMDAAEARAKCLDYYYLRSESSVRKRQYPKAVALQRLHDVHVKYSGQAMFHSTFTSVWDSLLSKVGGEFYELHDGDELYINIGTVEKPVWVSARSTSHVESWHHVVNKMDIATYGLVLQEACYVLCIGAWNHGKVVRILKKRVLEFTTDLCRLNELVVAANKLRDMKLMSDVARASLPYVDHQIVPPCKEKIVGMFAGKSETSASKALTLFLDKDGDETLFTRYHGADEDVPALEEATPRDLTSTGRELVGAMFVSSLFLKSSVAKKLATQPKDRAHVFAFIHENGVTESIDLAAMTLSFNTIAFDAMSSCIIAKRNNTAPPSVCKYGVVVDPAGLHITAPSFVHDHIANMVKSSVMRRVVPQNYGPVALAVVTAPPAVASIDGGALALPVHVVTDTARVVVAPNLVGVNPALVNNAPGYGVGRTAGTWDAEMVDVSLAETLRAQAPCAHCPFVTRCDATHKAECPFWLWQREPGVSQPSRTKGADGKVPNKSQAWVRAYLALSRAARLSICARHGCALPHAEWL